VINSDIYLNHIWSGHMIKKSTKFVYKRKRLSSYFNNSKISSQNLLRVSRKFKE